MKVRPNVGSAEQGFTLLELLVAITLLGLLMAALLGGLRLGARVWERGEARLDASSRIQVVQGFLRQRLAEALPVSALSEDGRAEEPVFRGEPGAIRFASPLPDYLGAGVYLMELGLADGGGTDRTNDLVLRWRPLEPGPAAAAGEVEPQARILLARVEALDIGYFGAADPRAPPAWWQDWQALPTLPGLVRVQVRFPAGDVRHWPELIVHPAVDLALAFGF